MSFAISATISRHFFVKAAQRYRPDTHDDGYVQPAGIGEGYEKALIYGAYVFCSYALYRVTLMIEASLHQSLPEQASFGLALQVLSFIFALSIVPINLRVRPLVQAVVVAKTGDSRPVESELALLLLLVNAVYIAAFAVFALTGPFAIGLIGTSGVSFPALADLMLIGLAFWVELNILTFVNVLTARNAFKFVFAYVGTALLCWMTCYVLLLADVPYSIAGFAAPVLIQGMVMLPFAILLCRSVAGVSLRMLGTELASQFMHAPSALHGVAATALNTFRR